MYDAFVTADTNRADKERERCVKRKREGGRGRWRGGRKRQSVKMDATRRLGTTGKCPQLLVGG